MVFHVQSENIKLNPKIDSACVPDVDLWCSDVSPGQGKVILLSLLCIVYYCYAYVYNMLVCVCVCVRACGCMRACVGVHVHVHAFMYAYMRECVCVIRLMHTFVFDMVCIFTIRYWNV